MGAWYIQMLKLYSSNTSIWTPYKKESLRLALIHSVMDTSEDDCIGSSALYTCRKCAYYHKAQLWQLHRGRERTGPGSVEVPDAMVTNTGDTSPSGPVSLVSYEVVSDSEDDLSPSKKSSCMVMDTEAGPDAEKLLGFTNVSIIPSDELFCMLMLRMQGDLEVGKVLCNFRNSCFVKSSSEISTMKEKEIYLRPITTVTRFGPTSKRPAVLDL